MLIMICIPPPVTSAPNQLMGDVKAGGRLSGLQATVCRPPDLGSNEPSTQPDSESCSLAQL